MQSWGIGRGVIGAGEAPKRSLKLMQSVVIANPRGFPSARCVESRPPAITPARCYNGPMAPPTKYSGTMNSRQFARAVERANVTELMVSRARRVLVDGETVQSVADADGVRRPVVYRAVQMISDKHRTMAGYWPGLSPMNDNP